MRRNKVQHQNEITFISLRIHPDTLNSYAEQSTELLVKYTLKELYLPVPPPPPINLTISKPEKQDSAEY